LHTQLHASVGLFSPDQQHPGTIVNAAHRMWRLGTRRTGRSRTGCRAV
jgi:hypothetical protein